MSPDHKYLAYTLDKNGSENFVRQVKDLRTGHILFEGVVILARSMDNSCLLYTVCDESLRPYKQILLYLALLKHYVHNLYELSFPYLFLVPC